MKKIFLIGLTAAAMLASCSNDETVEMAQQRVREQRNTQYRGSEFHNNIFE